MIALPIVIECKSKDEIIQQTMDVNRAIFNFYKEVPDNLLDSPAIPDGWSIKKNMKHVISTNNGLGRIWFSLPNFLLKLWFKPRIPQINIEKIDPTNRHGITDYGRYFPGRSHFEEKEKLLSQILTSSEALCETINKRSEEELDSLPGPFGGMSLRTFAYFIMKHNLHHTGVVRTRLLSRS
jgi:uncharacterized damage-inducible protein DinB